MDKLEERLDEAYNDLEEVEKLFDTLSQDEPERIDYCIIKRKLVCERIRAIKKEIELEQSYWSEFILSCMGIKKKPLATKLRRFLYQ